MCGNSFNANSFAAHYKSATYAKIRKGLKDRHKRRTDIFFGSFIIFLL